MNQPVDLPVDLALPHLAQALDESAMAGVFAAMVHMHGAQLERCSVERIKYRPRRNCTLSYRLHLRDSATGRAFEQHVAARLCSSDEAIKRATRASAAQLLPTLAGPALRLLPSLDMLTWWWPNDSKLVAPRVLADERAMRDHVLPQVVAALSGGHGKLAQYDVELVQYVPEHRLCVRVDLHWHGAGGLASQTVYAKSSREPETAAAHALLGELQSSAAWRAGQLRTPAAILLQPDVDLHWLQAVPGRALVTLPPTGVASWGAPLGSLLAALHGAPVTLLRTVTAASLRERLGEVSRTLAYVLPDSQAAIQQAVVKLEEGFPPLDAVPAAALHGDLHRGNILADGEQLAFIDLDGMRRGPAVMELGAWIADGMYHALLNGAAPLRDRASWQAMLQAYVGAGGTLPAARDLAWAAAWNLLCQRAWRCVVNLKPGRYAIAPRLIELAGEVAALPSLELA